MARIGAGVFCRCAGRLALTWAGSRRTAIVNGLLCQDRRIVSRREQNSKFVPNIHSSPPNCSSILREGLFNLSALFLRQEQPWTRFAAFDGDTAFAAASPGAAVFSSHRILLHAPLAASLSTPSDISLVIGRHRARSGLISDIISHCRLAAPAARKPFSAKL